MDPWSKGDYSRLIREASMAVEKLPVVILPSGRVPRRVLLALPILEARRRRNRDEIAKKGSVLEGFGTRGIYMRRVVTGGGEGAQAPPWRGQGWGRASRAPGAPLAALWPHFWHNGPSGAWIFCDFSWNFLRHLKIRFPAHNKTIQAALLKTASVRVSLVQIMQE